MFEGFHKSMRKRIFEIIEVSKDNDRLSQLYDWFMMLTICVSIIPLAFKTQEPIFVIVDRVTVIVFIIDYLLRLFTADYKIKRGLSSFFIYPFTIMALVDLVSILPSVTVVNSGFRLLKIFRLLRTFRVFRVFKAFRYSKNVQLVVNVFKRQKESLTVVGVLALGYILISALVVFNVEPDTFDTFFDAIYWATVSLTTVGYGDIFAVSTAGKVITMISSIFGIAIVALPAGIITAGYMEELNKYEKRKE